MEDETASSEKSWKRRWAATPESEKAKILDANAEFSHTDYIYSSARIEAEEFWCRQAAILIEIGVNLEVAGRICLTGYLSSYRENVAVASYERYCGFEYPGSHRIVSSGQAAETAVLELRDSLNGEISPVMFSCFAGSVAEYLGLDHDETTPFTEELGAAIGVRTRYSSRQG